MKQYENALSNKNLSTDPLSFQTNATAVINFLLVSETLPDHDHLYELMYFYTSIEFHLFPLETVSYLNRRTKK